MVKTGVLKKLAALTSAVALMGSFAAMAGAVDITTTTSYVADSQNQKVEVAVNVTGIGGELEVTYYATNADSEVVYVDQTTANASGAATFNYVTGAENLKSSVKVGYTDAEAAEEADVTGYTITCGEESAVVPTTNEGGTFTFPYTMPEGNKLDSVTSEDITVTDASYSEGTLTVVLPAVTKNVTLTVNTSGSTVTNPSGEYVDGAAIISDGNTDPIEEEQYEDAVSSEAGDRKVSVIGKVLDSEEYGVIISASEITAGNVSDLPSEGVYEAKGKNDSGYFAVQVIDNGAEGDELFDAEATYYTAVYYKTSTGYTIVAGENVSFQ